MNLRQPISLPASKTIQIPYARQRLLLFGIQLPYLPDFLQDHTLLGQSDQERLEEILGRFTRFVIGFRKYRNSAYSLRYVSHPAEGRIDVFLICRFLINDDQDPSILEQYWADISAHLNSHGLPHQPVCSQDQLGLDTILSPFTAQSAIVEVRQHETLILLMTVNAEAYVIHPYWRAKDSFLEPFEVMLRQNQPVAVSVYLEPTDLTTDEFNSLSEAGYLAQTVADMDTPVQSTTGIRRRRDPGAELVGKIYTEYLKSLDEPFIMVIQALSPNPNSAWTVARSFASSMASSNNLETDASSLPSSSDLVVPRNPDEYSRALNTFTNLLWSAWGETKSGLHKERLPFLCGASGASSAFRFPISIRGGVPGIAIRQQPPDFEPGQRPGDVTRDQVLLGTYRRGGRAIVRLNDLSRHTLITGFTGSGKTNTVLFLLNQIWKDHHIPFLVIEAAKKEYRALSRVPGFEDLLIFTLGDETTSPFRLNPFELLPGVRLEAHLGRLQACFDAALPQFGILPSIIAEAMEEIYKSKGWKLTDRAGENETRLFPTMRDLYTEVIRVAETRGYAGETYHNIRAAASGRIGSLLRGSKGRMFGCQHSFPAELIFNRPVILELNDLNEDDKALTMMYLLTWLREYREIHPANHLQHLTVVEEAHNVLSNTQSVGNTEIAADTKAKSVGAFSNMLSEVRAYGEGLVIADQSPEKLAPDAMRNTNLQIAHQLRDRRDREAIARAMIMDDEQCNFLGKLRVGEAAIFQTGLERATFVRIPEFKDSAGFGQIPSDDEIHEMMEDFHQSHLIQSLPFDGCRFCGAPCHYREEIEPLTLDKEIHEEFCRALLGFEEHPEPEFWQQNWLEIARVCTRAGMRCGLEGRLDAAYCYLAHEIDFQFTRHMRTMFEKAYTEHLKGG
ncbi:MAG TPA: ATP-binding protein [Anaerolineaceae bacterium]|nr:ATP-binding protein [Anaerolineaceae bacterium]HOH21342.1 ATP-binding protein [Anaerolineaceae bacterium]HQO98629.1 ATP-binding protein [Anaerolineaceae bacterium]